MASNRKSRGSGELDNEQKVHLLRELAVALSRLGVGAELLDYPGLTVSTPNPRIYFWVFVTSSGEFTWKQSCWSHPVDDVAGAAVAIAKSATELNGHPNGGVRS